MHPIIIRGGFVVIAAIASATAHLVKARHESSRQSDALRSDSDDALQNKIRSRAGSDGETPLKQAKQATPWFLTSAAATVHVILLALLVYLAVLRGNWDEFAVITILAVLVLLGDSQVGAR